MVMDRTFRGNFALKIVHCTVIYEYSSYICVLVVCEPNGILVRLLCLLFIHKRLNTVIVHVQVLTDKLETVEQDSYAGTSNEDSDLYSDVPRSAKVKLIMPSDPRHMSSY